MAVQTVAQANEMRAESKEGNEQEATIYIRRMHK